MTQERKSSHFKKFSEATGEGANFYPQSLMSGYSPFASTMDSPGRYVVLQDGGTSQEIYGFEV
jgi:hypothetical protein